MAPAYPVPELTAAEKVLLRQLQLRSRLKYAVDKGLSLMLSPLVLALLVPIALANAIEGWFDPSTRGPIFYRETRWSQGRPFEILKFRVARVGSQNAGEVGSISRVGLFLKQYYLDEIPQVWNVLKGEMTFVGPRPNIPQNAYREVVVEGMRSKLLLRAGLAGAVQARKREASDRNVYASIEDAYLAEVSRRGALGVVLLDLRLMVGTLRVVLRGEGL